ncbi:hypothetical protein [Caballeronia sp. LjRoot31]|uniref:hypothetical protein n=1 Tax=Caballeronia sp. LjRoot31 TaxID=3342324 RepID=UPI003ED0A146
MGKVENVAQIAPEKIAEALTASIGHLQAMAARLQEKQTEILTGVFGAMLCMLIGYVAEHAFPVCSALDTGTLMALCAGVGLFGGLLLCRTAMSIRNARAVLAAWKTKAEIREIEIERRELATELSKVKDDDESREIFMDALKMRGSEIATLHANWTKSISTAVVPHTEASSVPKTGERAD